MKPKFMFLFCFVYKRFWGKMLEKYDKGNFFPFHLGIELLKHMAFHYF